MIPQAFKCDDGKREEQGEIITNWEGLVKLITTLLMQMLMLLMQSFSITMNYSEFYTITAKR